jgi:hypothetical protein
VAKVYSQHQIQVNVIEKSKQQKNDEPKRSEIKIIFYNKESGRISQYPTQVFINKIQFTQDTLAVYEQKLFSGKYFFEFLLLGSPDILRKKIKVKTNLNYEVKVHL